MPLTRAFCVFVLAWLLAGCATPVYNRASNAPLGAATPPNMGAPADSISENAIVLALSGGGLRAAAFSYGVLRGLEEIQTGDGGDLLGDVALINSVSGSSLTAAYYGLYGREGLPRFDHEVLRPGFEQHMRTAMSVTNVLRVLGGGANAREDFGEVLDRQVFHGATFHDIYARKGPEIRIHATDLYHRIAFPFMPQAFAALCSDLSRYPVADAVAASMAVPVVFAPVVVQTFPAQCGPLPEDLEGFMHPAADAPLGVDAIARALARYRESGPPLFIKLADGGLTDNFGVSTLIHARVAIGTPHAPLTQREAVRVRRLILLVVDASRGPAGDWVLHEQGPSGVEAVIAATDAAIDAATREAADSFSRMIREWQQSIVAYRCGLSPEEVARLGGPAQWHCADVQVQFERLSIDRLPPQLREQVNAVPTRLSLPAADLDASIRAGREATLTSARLRRYAAERVR